MLISFPSQHAAFSSEQMPMEAAIAMVSAFLVFFSFFCVFFSLYLVVILWQSFAFILSSLHSDFSNFFFFVMTDNQLY